MRTPNLAISQTLPEVQQGESNGSSRLPDIIPLVFKKADYAKARHLPGHATILLGEDNPSDVLLLREALRSHDVKSSLFVAEDGEDAIRLVSEIDAAQLPCPDLIILDLNLPRKTGFEVLERLRISPLCGGKPIVILSSSGAPADRDKALRMGASCYIQKPSDLKDFMSIGSTVKSMLLDSTR